MRLILSSLSGFIQLRPIRSLMVLVVGGALLLPLAAGKKKNKEETTQTLEAPPDPPAAVVAETRRLVFQTSPLSGKGLLSQQTRDAVYAILKQSGNLPIVKLRAFVAGSGDLRRVPQIVSEIFAEKKHLQLPAVSVIQAGGLPLEGAQVVLESVSVMKHDVNPNGLVFVSARERTVAQPQQALGPLAEASLADLAAKLNGRGTALRVTCFATALDDAAGITRAMEARFPEAALDLVQTRRVSARSSVACEAIGRAASFGAAAGSAHDPDVAVVTADRLVMTGTQAAYGFTDEDAKLAYRRLDKVLSPFGASTRTAVMLSVYPLSGSITAQNARVRPEFLEKAHPPVITALPFEGLPGMDASFAVEAVAPATQVPGAQ